MADLIVDETPHEEIMASYQGMARKSPLIEGAYEAEDYFIVPDGTGKWMHFTASPIRNNAGQVIGAIETLEDITEQKKAEAALRESEKNFRNLFESAMDAIWVDDVEGNIKAANEATATLSGYSIQELCQSNTRLFLAEKSQRMSRDIQKSLLANKPVVLPYEMRLIRRDGSEAICMVTTNLIAKNGKGPNFQNIARDMTKEKMLYQNQQYYLQEITRAQEEERKRIARELHDSTAQNLIALLHQLENLLDDKTRLPVKQAKAMWELYERIRDILQEVRRFSRDLRPSILDDLGLLPALEWLIGELRNEYAIESNLKVIGIERRLTPEAELLFFRIAQEAMANTAKHARASRVEVVVNFGDKKIQVTISDNGQGFKPPVNPGDLAYSGKLGLAGMLERTQLLGGNLQIQSEPGKGTRITIEAPV